MPIRKRYVHDVSTPILPPAEIKGSTRNSAITCDDWYCTNIVVIHLSAGSFRRRHRHYLERPSPNCSDIELSRLSRAAPALILSFLSFRCSVVTIIYTSM
jgi:hypothetical protein